MGWLRLGSADAAEELRWPDPPAFLPPPSFASHTGEFLRGLRVVAGPTGSGKSRVLSAVREAVAADDVRVLVDYHTLHTRTIDYLARRDLDGTRSSTQRIEYWENVWRTVLLATVATFADEIVHALEEHCRTRLSRLHAYSVPATSQSLLSASDSLSMPYAEMAAIRHRSSDSAFFFDPRWDEIEQDLALVLEKQARLHIFMEAAEEVWEASPRLALECTQGLVLQALQLAKRDHPLSGTVAVTLPVRAMVLRAVQGRSAGTAFRSTGQLAALTWTPQALDQLLRSRVSRIAPDVLLRPEANAPMERICGLPAITIVERGSVAERLEDYVLRHCSGTPRDIINLANSLLAEAQRAKFEGTKVLDPSVIKKRVAVEAHAIGTELLNQASTSLAASLPIEEEDLSGPALFDDLVAWIGLLPSDQPSASDISAAVEGWPYEATRRALVNTLWRCGVIGRVIDADREGARVHYFDPQHDLPDLSLSEMPALALHPSMVEVASLAPNERLLAP